MATQRIREFSEGVQYVLGDVALYNDAASSTTIVKRCKKNTPIGEFQANDWEDIFSFPTSKKNLQGVINTAERITTQTLLYGERMSRVTAIPHLIPQTKMVKVMQALEKRAPRSTENLGGKEYKLKGNVYCSIDRQTTDGKDITDIGYVPFRTSSNINYGRAITGGIEWFKQPIIISSDNLPFLQVWLSVEAKDAYGAEASYRPVRNGKKVFYGYNDMAYYYVAPFDAKPFSLAMLLSQDELSVENPEVTDRRLLIPAISSYDDKLVAVLYNNHKEGDIVEQTHKITYSQPYKRTSALSSDYSPYYTSLCIYAKQPDVPNEYTFSSDCTFTLNTSDGKQYKGIQRTGQSNPAAFFKKGDGVTPVEILQTSSFGGTTEYAKFLNSTAGTWAVLSLTLD